MNGERNMSLLVISPWGADIGFRLGGADVAAVAGSEALNTLLETAISNREIGIIAIPEKMESAISTDIKRRLSKQLFPMTVFYPLSEEWEAVETVESEIEEMVFRSVGYRMRIKP